MMVSGPTRNAILRVLSTTEPKPMREICRALDRDDSNVRHDLIELQADGIVLQIELQDGQMGTRRPTKGWIKLVQPRPASN